MNDQPTSRSHRKLALNVALVFLVALPIAVLAQMPKPSPITAPAEPNAIPLYGPPKPGIPPEQWENFGGARSVRNVVSPTLTPVLPDPASANGTAIIVAPGGAFRFLAIDPEGYAVARWLADRGITAFVLKYRTEPTPRDPGAYTAEMNRLMAGFLADVSKGQHNPKTPAAALEDTQAAVKLVRERAAEWKIDPKRVGVIGFSAGALMAVSDAVAPDRAGRADFIGSLYGQLVPQPVPSDASPMFAAMASDDPLSGQGGFELITAWQKANRPVELHLYAKGGHGFSLRHQGTTSDLWPEQFHAWMKAQGFLGAPGK